MSIPRRVSRPENLSEQTAVRSVLLASEGRLFTDEVIDYTASLAGAEGASVRVLTVARLWGTGLGLPHPGLRPNKAEMAIHEDNVATAIERLKAAGIEAEGHIVTTRKAGRSILRQASGRKCDAIVMAADTRRSRVVGNFMWSQEPYRVHRRAPMPVHLVESADHSPATA